MPTSFHNLPPDAYPFELVLLDAETRAERWRVTVSGPGAVHVPSRDEINEGKAMIGRIELTNDGIREIWFC